MIWIIKFLLSLLAMMTLMAAKLATAQACFFFFHQPKAPSNISQ